MIFTSVRAFAPNRMARLAPVRALSMAKGPGDVIPSITFKCRVRDESLPGPNPFKWKDVTTDDLFKGKRVVLFALPGGLLQKVIQRHLS
jgi:peroxiredoxin